jgi:hypothetical protein
MSHHSGRAKDRALSSGLKALFRVSREGGKSESYVIPVLGDVSQNWVCSNCPPGALKQQRSVTAVVFPQLSCGLEHVSAVPASALGKIAPAYVPGNTNEKPNSARDRKEAIVGVRRQIDCDFLREFCGTEFVNKTCWDLPYFIAINLLMTY